jgi:hypothetical protein
MEIGDNAVLLVWMAIFPLLCTLRAVFCALAESASTHRLIDNRLFFIIMGFKIYSGAKIEKDNR